MQRPREQQNAEDAVEHQAVEVDGAERRHRGPLELGQPAADSRDCRGDGQAYQHESDRAGEPQPPVADIAEEGGDRDREREDLDDIHGDNLAYVGWTNASWKRSGGGPLLARWRVTGSGSRPGRP